VYKVIHFVKRKAGITHEQFREHMERSHAPLAMKYCGHLFTEYRRNYVSQAMFGGDPRDAGGGFRPQEWEWDLISEWVMPNEAAFHEIYRIMQDPAVDALFHADEDRFIDRTAFVTAPVTVVDTGVTFNPKGTVFDTPDGEPRWD
jgi:hypothetical protein